MWSGGRHPSPSPVQPTPPHLPLPAAASAHHRLASHHPTPTPLQPEDAPAFNQQLVGKHLEVLWKYIEKDTGKPHLVWCTGRVVRVVDGLSDKRSKRAKKILPAGALLWAWDADPVCGEAAGEQWLVLLPGKWNPKTHTRVFSWRFDPCERRAVNAPTPEPSGSKRRRAGGE